MDADMLSGLPLQECPSGIALPGETVLMMEMLQASPMNFEHIRKWTDEDSVLKKVKGLLTTGWTSDDCDEDLKPFRKRKEELSLQSGCILLGGRVIVPEPG